MSKSRKAAIAGGALALLTAMSGHALAQDAAAGEKVFRKCAACHEVGGGASNKVGPQLNELIGRAAGSVEGFRYSKAMVEAGEGGLVWNDETLSGYLANPRSYLKGTKMAFAGLKKEDELADVIAYLKTYSAGAGETGSEEPAGDTGSQESDAGSAAAETQTASAAPAMMAKDFPLPDHGVFKLGRAALPEEVSAWDIDIRPDGAGLPAGKGTVAMGEPIYEEQCAVCHGTFGEGAGRWPVLAGGQDTLTAERPEKTIGSYWPYLSTVYDYVRRAMPFGNARSLSDDEVYALTAYLLYLNDVVSDEDFELSNENFTEVRLPNEENFFMDDRDNEPHYAAGAEPCMKVCKAEPAGITMRARVLDVTPDSDESEGVGPIE